MAKDKNEFFDDILDYVIVYEEIPTYDDLSDYYDYEDDYNYEDDEDFENEYEESSANFEICMKELEPYLNDYLNGDIEIYDHDVNDYYLQLSDNPTWNYIDNPTVTEDNYDLLANDFDLLAIDYIKQFEENCNVKIEQLGQSGRYICIELNKENLMRYDELAEIWEDYEQEFIDELNAKIY